MTIKYLAFLLKLTLRRAFKWWKSLAACRGDIFLRKTGREVFWVEKRCSRVKRTRYNPLRTSASSPTWLHFWLSVTDIWIFFALWHVSASYRKWNLHLPVWLADEGCDEKYFFKWSDQKVRFETWFTLFNASRGRWITSNTRPSRI